MSSAVRTLIAPLFILLLLLLPMGMWRQFENADYTAGELIEYAIKRLDGHPRLNAFASPLLTGLSSWIGYTPKNQRAVQLFIVPAPPPLLISPDFKKFSAPGSIKQSHILSVGPSKSIQNIAQAATLARDGDIIEIDAGEYHGDVAVWSQKALTIRGVGGNARLFSDGATAEGKAIWVIRSGKFTIENIDFIGAHVPDHNGAGIRFESGSLRIHNCLFFGNENGLLTSDNSNSELEISDSEFSYNGSGDGYSHNLYVGKIYSLKVSGSYFHHANVGHLLKSRAEFNDIEYNRLTDEDGGRASYELDMPNGGVTQIIGNIIQKNQEAENSTVIAYGEEGYSWPSNDLYLASNTLVNDLTNGGIFLKVSPGFSKIISINNLLVGNGNFNVPLSAVSINDIHVDWGIFVSAPRQDYRLNATGRKFEFVTPPAQIAQEIDLNPLDEYQHPRHTRTLSALPRFPGALQSAVQ
jgi:hypothetical protein